MFPMTRKEAIRILKAHNAWRRGNEEEAQQHPYTIGEAIDLAVSELEKLEAGEVKP